MPYKVSNPRKVPIFDLRNAFKLMVTAITIGIVFVLLACAFEGLGLQMLANVIGWTGLSFMASAELASQSTCLTSYGTTGCKAPSGACTEVGEER